MKIKQAMEILDSLPKEDRDSLVEKYYVDYKNLSPAVKKMKEAFDTLDETERDEFMKCIDYKKPSERFEEEKEEPSIEIEIGS